MKTKYMMAGIVSFLMSILVMAGNDPQVNRGNYKHPNKAAKARQADEAAAKQDKTVVTKTTQNEGNYKNNFPKSEYTYEKVPANQKTNNPNYKPINHNYKRQF